MFTQYRTTSILCAALVCVLQGSGGAFAGTSTNVAWGKLVTSNIAESETYGRDAGRLTDGNVESDAYPGAFSLDYTVNLTSYAEGKMKDDVAGFDLMSLVIDWRKFGRHFPGVKQADGSWAPAAYKADYVNWYQIDYATVTGDNWETLHEWSGRPTEDDVAGFDLMSLVIDWGKFGRHFPGVKQADGSWAPAAYKADYVNWYQIDYATGTGDDWETLHECSGRPTEEDAKGVTVQRIPANASFSEGEVRTTLDDLNLRNVSRIRIRARGAHWIGIHELSAFGSPSLPGTETAGNLSGDVLNVEE